MEDIETVGASLFILATFAMAVLYYVQLWRFAAVLKRDHGELWVVARRTASQRESNLAIASGILLSQDFSTLSVDAARSGRAAKRFLYLGLGCFFVLLAVGLWVSVAK